MTSVPVPAAEAPPAEPSGTKIGPVVIAFVVGTAVSFGLGVYGRLHTPSGHAVNLAGFSTGAAAKAFLASGNGAVRANPFAWRLGRCCPSLVWTRRCPDLGAGRSALSLRVGFSDL